MLVAAHSGNREGFWWLTRPEKPARSIMEPKTPVAFIEWKVPSFAFASREIQVGYIAEATNIVHEAAGGRQPKEHIWCNVVHAVDGAWGIAGEAPSNAQLGESVSKG
jgi:hypothetical protein